MYLGGYMRISTLKNDVAYVEDGSKFKVLFNGELQPFCVMADEDEGIVEVEQVHEIGNVPYGQPRITKHGKVEILCLTE